MRIAVLSKYNRVVGGVEEYLRIFLSAAADSGNEVGFWYESDVPPDRPAIPAPPDGEWSVAKLGRRPALAALRAWRPDVIYAHGLHSPELEDEAYGIAPAVFFAHVYAGACISGAKTTWFPVARPCNRRFGSACLAHYFPRRCGGLNPLTMRREYALQSHRLKAIRKCAAVVTHSEHMRAEYIRLGIPADRIFNFPFCVAESAPEELPQQPLTGPQRLLFLGRMEALKGGRVLLDALPQVRAALGGPLRLVFAGDGRERPKWESRAKVLQGRDSGLSIEFTGWVGPTDRSALFRGSDLLVVPSIWPEPFGMVGPEAGLYGVPAAAFAVGGTSSWLIDGVNGFLAHGDPPRASGLALAITRCLAHPATHQQLRDGAVRLAGRFTWANHYSGLMAILGQVARSGSSAGSAGKPDV
jgi:glycosyltransferase involved in cell wall biosynthesis